MLCERSNGLKGIVAIELEEKNPMQHIKIHHAINHLWDTDACKSQSDNKITPKRLEIIIPCPMKYGEEALDH